MTNKTFFYIRVSTAQQGRSGLGIEAQRRALQQFAQTEGIELLGEPLVTQASMWHARVLLRR